MNRDNAVEVLETINEMYPKFDLSKRKARMLLRTLQEMDYTRVMDKLSKHVATYPYAPTIEEIAAYPPVENNHLQLVRAWKREAAMVPADVKADFYQKMNALLSEKAAGTESISSYTLSLQDADLTSTSISGSQESGKEISHDR